MRGADTVQRKASASDVLITAVLLVLGILTVIPFVWMTIVSFERYANIQPPFPPSFIPKHPSFFNFKIAFENGYIISSYKNSAVVAVFSVLLDLASALLAGYAFSKGSFKYKTLLFYIVMATMMLPFEARMIPMYMMFSRAGLTNSFLPLILPNLIDGFGILLTKQYFDQLPGSLREAAHIDGSSEFRTFFSVFLPLTGPISSTLCILKFMGSWNSFIWPLVILTGQEMRTVPIFLASFSGEGGTRAPGLTMCVAFLGIIPVILVFLFLQKYIIRSIALSGLKGE